MKKDVQIGEISDLARKMKLYKDDAGPSPITFLIGAGCSVTAGIPSVVQIAKNLTVKTAKKYGAIEIDDPEEALEFLFSEGHFKRLAKDRSSQKETHWQTIYDVLFKEMYSSPDDTRDVFKAIIDRTDPKINWAHLALGELAKENWLGTTITTNFDLLALEGYARAGVFPVVSDGLDSLDRIDPNPSHPQLIQINGSIHSYRLRNDESDLDDVQTSAAAITCFRSLFQSSRVFVVIGYAGREPQIMKLLRGAAEAYPDKHVFWSLYGDNPDEISENASEFLKHSKNARLILGQSADTFFLELSKELNVHAPLAFRDPLKYMSEQLDEVFDPTDMRDLDRVTGEIQALRDELKLLRDYKTKKAKSNKAKIETSADSDLDTPETSVKHEARRIFEELRVQAANDMILFDDLRRAQEQKYQSGLTSGDKADWKLSIELARIGVSHAKNSAQRNAALTDLGIALRELGHRERDTALLNEAITTSIAALEEVSRDHAPLEWAVSQSNLGNALLSFGECGNDTARLNEAVTVYKTALTVQSRDKVPMQWAVTHNNIGVALLALGKRESGIARLEEAITAFATALEERTRDKVPFDWAFTQENLALVEKSLFAKNGNVEHLDKALAYAKAAQEVYVAENGNYYIENIAKEISEIQTSRDEAATS